ncbi:hypothetical protein ACF0H5_006124 [Mactra antiquata]
MDLRQRRQNVLNFIVLFIVFLSLFHYSDADCSITTSGVHTFGPECQYMCHCKNGESCDTTTGECTSGCDRHWFGPGCQYADLAENEFSRHASNTKPSHWSFNGNDGDTSTCSYTQVATLSTNIPWWRVVLETEVNITDIYILTTDDGLQYFPDFEVTVEKLLYANRKTHSNPPPDTRVCYKHGNTVPDSTSIHVACTEPLIGNQVRITLSKKESQLILCDFRINLGRNLAFQQSVISSAIYNNDSQYQASYAVDGLVSPAGQCFRSGNFSIKWLQVELDQLMDVKFFNICKYNDDYINSYKIYDTTSDEELLYDSGSDQSSATRGYLNRNLQNLRVEKTSGDIMAICELKLYGDCPVHQCGYNCSTICHCKTLKSLEDKIAGICTSGCEGRWTGVNGKCNIECSDNKWGTSCQNDCGACRQGTCDVVSGKCTGDCQDGYYNTDDCETECNYGTYGYKCQSNCSDTCQNSCNKVNGTCIGGCKSGYMGEKCEQECFNGTYGYKCQSNCSDNCQNSCNKINGTCIDGCKPGYMGDKCERECFNGTYGYKCQSNCSDNCQNSCNKINGTCIDGCKPGYMGDKCERECNYGTYGYKCQSNCSDTCQNSCNKVNGTCIGGCKSGYMGHKCEQECFNGTYGYKCQSNCSDNCQNSCNKINGTCIGGCKPGYMGDKCERECNNGTYGYKCQSNCSDNCQNSCNKVNGTCIGGCKSGYMGHKCEQECDAGTFGQKCQNQCNENCNDTCHHVSGNCTSCKAGWTGNVCDTECANGTYGIKCGNNCTRKCLKVCDKINGFCSSCTPGWIGNFCENECANRTYGLNCNESCNSNCEDVCDHVTGECTQCKAGWKNDFCDKECDNGTFGVNCSENCTSKCLNVCDKQTGDCLECQNGWTGNICQTECTNGTYGSNCKQNCSKKCTDICERVDGSCNCMTGWHGDTCLHECENGSYGDYCKEQCGYCYNNTACDTINGTCTLGCDSGYEGSLCKIVTEPPGESLPVAAIAGASSTFVVVAIIAVVGFIIIRRRLGFKNNANTESIDGKEVEWKNVSHNSEKNESDNLRSTHRIKQDGSVYENSLGLSPELGISEDVQPMASSTLTNPPSNAKEEANEYYVFGSDTDYKKTARVITLNEITQYVKSKLATVDFFDREFQDIPYGLQHPTLDARKPGNIGKNRYKELYAYDHSRVVLKTLPSEPNSDYINASYIKGYNKDRAYIASQGPTVKNKNEFWRMIWENNVNLIAMVTKLIEETKNKCTQYWAENGNGKTFGKVTVFTESEEEFAEYSIRRLKITYDGEKENRYVLHYIYTAWPDKNIPHSTCSLLHFWQKVRKNDANKANPWLVHCSAGIGRTGTFIAIDYLYDQGRDAGYIDINACVRQLRDQRVNMVQMKEQYRYLYRMMIEALVLPSTPVLLHKFDSYYAELLTEDEKSRQPKLKLEFEVMSQTDCLVKDSETQEYAYKDAKHADNKVKNRYSNILAPDEYRPFMSTQVPGTTNYINAMYMPSYSDLFGYIITQTPLPDTAVDCCRLIIDQDINVVVTFEDNGDNE